MVNKELRAELPEDALVFDNPSFDNSIIGVSHDDRVVYDYDKMLEEYMQDENCSIEEASEWISYNTIRSIGYSNEGNPPIVMFNKSNL